MLIFGRILRNIKAMTTYPIWVLSGKPSPDNHVYKKKRVRSIGVRYSCETFIETGTFYGQMVDAVKDRFKKVLSVELFEPLYYLNRSSFESYPQIRVYLGDSSARLHDMLQDSSGRILFWLDGHFSGEGTACGDQVSPILQELDLIKAHPRRDHCILIDDSRLFTGVDGYPTIEATKEKLREINPDYMITIDHDCILALPEN